MRVTLWGTRGSLASPGPDTVRYGGNTSCVSVEGEDGTLLVLDAGTGIRCLGTNLPESIDRVHILLTHLHMDHLQGLPFFDPLRRSGVEVHIWGPASTTLALRARLLRYLSPPLFPVSVRELPSDLNFHEVPYGPVEVGEFEIVPQLIIHYNPTVGYRINSHNASLTYLPDHEPALSGPDFPNKPAWTSGYDLAAGADLLIHDSQYTIEEYDDRRGFGHSTMMQAFHFAKLAGVKQLAPFHHDPSHSDDMIDEMITQATSEIEPGYIVTPGQEGTVFNLG